MALPGYHMDTLADFTGKEIGTSAWVSVDQRRIDEFADCTGDRQWIHVDVGRAQRESPYGGTIAHGYLTLSLAGSLSIEAGAIPPDAAVFLNYGLGKVRFLAPVRAGARVRNRVVLLGVRAKAPDHVLIKLQNTIEIEDEDKPALIAETLIMLMARRARIDRAQERIMAN